MRRLDMQGHEEMLIIIMIMALLLSMNAPAYAAEPSRPEVNRMFDAGKEARISGLAGLSVQEVFEQLKTPEFLLDADFTYKAVYKSFLFRKQDGLNFAVRYLGAPLTEVSGDRVLSRRRDFTVAKRVIETFPEDSTPMLVSLYERGDAVVKGNIIQAAGMLAGGQEIRDLLVRALDDTAAYEEEDPDSAGEPLRICDVAYNQLVLRYGIRNVLRTLSPWRSIAIRDYHINNLKGLLSKEGITR